MSDEQDDETINASWDIVDFSESMMTEREIKLRDEINKELAIKGYHVRVARVQIIHNDIGFDYVQPVDIGLTNYIRQTNLLVVG